MSKPQSKVQHTNFASLSFGIGANGTLATDAHLLPAGEFRAEDGRPFDTPSWHLTADIAAKVIAKLAAKKNDTLVDYEHQSLRAEMNGQPVPAAGWFHGLEFRDDGLWATDIDWTATAKKLIAASEYRYISAVFLYYTQTGEVSEILSVALTNTPAIDGLASLAALTKYNTLPNNNPLPNGDEDMATEKEELAALTTNVASLTAENKTLQTSVAALTAENATLQAQVKAAEDEKAAVALAAEQAKHAETLQAALASKVLAPAQKAWAEKLSLAQLTEFVTAATPLLPDGRQAQADLNADHGLTIEEQAMCTRMGVKPEDFAANKKAAGK